MNKDISKKEEICKANRTGQYIDNLPEIADSGLRLYERKIDLSFCKDCDSNTTHEGKKYCLLTEDEYQMRG